MGDDCYSLIFIPDARSPSRKLRVPVRLVHGVLGTTVVVALAMAALLVHYVWLSRQVSELDRLRRENAALSAQLHDFNVTLGSVEGRIAGLQLTVTKLGVVSGLEQTLPGAGGVAAGLGGATWTETAPPWRDPEAALEAMAVSLGDLASRSTRIESFYADQTELLSRTPSIWPVRGYLSSAFGRRNDPFTGQTTSHPGIDISAPRGTEVKAPADGVVVSVGRRHAYGKAIVIDHGFDVVTRYGHLDGYNVRAGQRVHRGDVIGFVGSSGRSNGPHLHYEVWVQDKLQDPTHFILDEYRTFG